MPKINIKVKVNDEIANFYKAIYQEEKSLLTYRDENNTLVKFNYKEHILIRENEEIKMEYKFIKNANSIGKIFIKDLNKDIYLDIKTIFFQIKNQNLNIKYNIEQEEFSYIVEVIE